MIIGRFCIDPSDVCAGSVTFDPETSYYRVVIECAENTIYSQSVMKKAEADKLLKLIDKAIVEGASIREAEALAERGKD
jgi:hypothetical protein